MQRKLLRYSFKKACTYIPKVTENKILQKVFFIQKFLEFMENKNAMIFSSDEMGIGTNPLRKYGYSHIGCPAIIQYKQMLP